MRSLRTESRLASLVWCIFGLFSREIQSFSLQRLPPKVPMAGCRLRQCCRKTEAYHSRNPSRNQHTELHALVPISAEEASDLLATTGPPTGAQYATYWGRTPQERYGRVLESAIVSFLGVFFSYFLSFVIGGFVSTILGCMFVFWGVLNPEFQAYQRNWEFLGGRPLVDVEHLRGKDPDKAGLYPAIFLGRILDLCVVESANDADEDEYDIGDFDDYQMVTDELEQFSGEPYLLRVRCIDQTGRKLQVHTRLSEEYVGGVLQVGMPVTAVLLSTQQRFSRLAALTDLFVPDAGIWIGDYPYLNREVMENLLAADDELWDSLQKEATEWDDRVDTDNGADYDAYDYFADEDLVPVKRRSGRKQ